MTYDYSVEIASLQRQITDMSNQRAEILQKINTLQTGRKVINKSLTTVEKNAQDLPSVKNQATENFIGTRREHFNAKVDGLTTAVKSWVSKTNGNLTTIDQKISSLKAAAANLNIGMSYANKSLSEYYYLQSVSKDK